MAVIQGVVERITFRNEENFYTVAKIQRENNDYFTTVVGTFPSINIGETIRAEGEWVTHIEYGTQFKVQSYETVVPASIGGIEKYLGSGMIKGIGPSTARSIVEHFGLETLKIIDETPERLTEIEGIGPKKVEMITSAFEEQKEIRKVMIFLQGVGISPAYAVKIYKHYGDDAIKVVKENPYALAEDVFGIGFKIADSIAQKVGVPPDSPERIETGLLYVLNQFNGDGNVFARKGELMEEASQILEVSHQEIQRALDDLERRRAVFLERRFPVENDEDLPVYLAPFYYSETGLAMRLTALARAEFKDLNVDIHREMSWLEGYTGMKFAEEQRLAIDKAMNSGILVITGGPGTGKTTTLNGIIKLLNKYEQKVLLAAPTGRAAKRLSEATGEKAKTIHRLLEFSYTEGEGMGFQRNEWNQLEADVIIIDEMSMVDLILMYNLVKAIPLGTRLIMVGDVDQLPSVGPGNVLKDIIDSNTVGVVRLNRIFRQAQESMIIVNAHKVNRGEYPILNSHGKDFFFVEEKDRGKLPDVLVDLVSRRLPKYTGYSPMDIQLLTPLRKTNLGADSLNPLLQDAINPSLPSKREVRFGAAVFREGDKVMQIKNNYRKSVFNGDIGVISAIDTEERETRIIFPEAEGEREVIYEPHEMDELLLAYATSIHKSQGSEYPAVVIPMMWIMPTMMMRNLLYTGITRGKKLVVLVGDKRAIWGYIKNTSIDERNTLLKERLGSTQTGIPLKVED
jgi:exodeoxyribonuclease V alpha subunit